MSTAVDICRAYNEVYSNKIESLKEKIDGSIREKLFFANLIANKYAEFVYDNPVLSYIQGVLSSPLKHFNYDKVSLLYSNFSLFDYNRVNIRNDESKELFNIYEGFRKAVEKENDLVLKLDKYNKINFNDRVIKYLYQKYFEQVSYQLLLLGEAFVFGKSNIYIKVKGKTRVKNKLKPDWGESLKLLKVLAKDLNPTALGKYQANEISKVAFIEEMKPLLYNKDTNPLGKKWIVYDNKTFDHWLILHKHYCTIEGGQYLGVTPSNYIINDTKSQNDFVKNAKGVDDVIYSSELGFRDKLRALEKIDMDFCLNTYDNDL